MKIVRENTEPLETAIGFVELSICTFEFVDDTPPATPELTWRKTTREVLLMQMGHSDLRQVIGQTAARTLWRG